MEVCEWCAGVGYWFWLSKEKIMHCEVCKSPQRSIAVGNLGSMKIREPHGKKQTTIPRLQKPHKKMEISF